MNIILISEQRVGSRWLLFLLMDLYKLKASPELAKNRHYGDEREVVLKTVRDRFKKKQIVKFHHITPGDIFGNFFPIDYKVVGIVRNPRDRGVSVAFHHKYDNLLHKWPQKWMDENQAVRYTILEYPRYPISNSRQLDIMIPGYSTRSRVTYNNLPYIWTSYEWLKEDIVNEISKIIEFLGRVRVRSIEPIIRKHSFEKKSRRPVGVEKRNDLWRRKGISGDWQNWFDKEMLRATDNIYKIYFERINQEKIQFK